MCFDTLRTKEEDMEISSRIKHHRTTCGLSQEDLAEKIYVTRNTISNWETGRTYPDVQSLLLLSSLFSVSIDDLVQGDVEMLNETARADTKKLNLWAGICIAFAVLTLLSLAGMPFVVGMPWAFIPTGVCVLIACIAALRTIQIMKDIDIVTTAEMVAFLEGRPVNRDEEKRAKWCKQKIVIGIVVTLIGGLFGALIGLLTYKAGL